MNTQTTIISLKQAIITYVSYYVQNNKMRNSVYADMADDIYREKIAPFVIKENIEGFESDIKRRFLDDPSVKFNISEKQAYCLARAFMNANPDTIVMNAEQIKKEDVEEVTEEVAEEVAEVPAVKKEVETLTVGDKVSNEKFGEGVVVNIDTTTITVDFEGDVRKMITKYAGLQKMA